MIQHLYADGGCIAKNPSPHGGTWAWVAVDEAGKEVRRASGVILPSDASLPAISNNLSELFAALQGLVAMPFGWHGTLFTDSLVTLRRVERYSVNPSMNGIPDVLRAGLREAKRRLGSYQVVLLGGHPTKAELVDGFRRDGQPCSPWNVLCDRLCGEEAKCWWQREVGKRGCPS